MKEGHVLVVSIVITENISLTGFYNMLMYRGKLHNEELHNLYPSPSIIRMIKSMRMHWAGHVARMGAKRNAYRLLVGNPEEK
jgi:hypothetical protein